MKLKKFTRWFFYAFGAAGALALAYLIVEFAIRHWTEMSKITIALGGALVVLALFHLGRWAFSPDKEEVNG